MLILGIETSCDETAASVVSGDGKKIDVLSNVVSSQIEIHKKYGGVIPEVAAREHVLNILPVINDALKRAGIKKPAPAPKKHPSGKADFNYLLASSKKNSKDLKIDAIAVANGPGLISSLMVGVETAKALALAWSLPIVEVNHIEGHIYSNFIRDNLKKIEFPAIVLTVSGGHTLLALMEGHGKLKTIGNTLDDAAGEAFDKAAQMLGLGYPGGPSIAIEASKSPSTKQKENKIKLPRPMINKGDLNFSFSGLKTALLYELKKDKNWRNKKAEYASEFQQAIIDVLINKTLKAAKKYRPKTIMLSGGVSANLELRKQMACIFAKPYAQTNFFVPNLKYTTDNAAMVASAGYFKAIKKNFSNIKKLKALPNLNP